MDKRTVIALLVVALVFIFYDDYLRWMYPPQEGAQDSTLVDTVRTVPRRAQTVEKRETYLREMPEDYSQEALQRGDITEILTEPDTLSEVFVEIETDRIRARLSSDGARLVSYRLKSNGRYLNEELELLPEEVEAGPGFRFWTVEGPVETTALSYRLAGRGHPDGGTYRIYEGQKRKVEFVTSLGQERRISVIYTFYGGGYAFDCRVGGEGLESLWGREYVEVYWSGGLRYTEPDTSQEVYYSKAYTYFSGNILEKLKINTKKTEVSDTSRGSTLWGAVRTKYFMAALIPETRPAEECWMESVHDSNYIGKYHPNRLGVYLRVPLSGGVPATPMKIFIGPLDTKVVNAVEPSLKETMNWGWAIIAPFSKAVLWSLKHLRGIIPNYGVCVIIFSILIKVIVWPLTRKSYRSMAAMQKLQPKIKELKEKYKSDPQALQKKTMKLYKEEKVNPMGGCLPMLLQMPLLYALFIVFRSTIEFRNAPFVLWIKDLSQPDIIFHLPFTLPMYGSHVALLPIIMGISTFYQSKSTMTDPSQKAMLYIMPIFMTLIFNQFPSGLTLYYTLFNVLTLIQQRFTQPPKPAEAKAS